MLLNVLAKKNRAQFVYFFLMQGIELKQNLRKGIIIGKSSLVLQGLQRNATGDYYCVATNIEGATFSNPIQLNVKCKTAFSGKNYLVTKSIGYTRPFLQ